jgi:hypothetical protein
MAEPCHKCRDDAIVIDQGMLWCAVCWMKTFAKVNLKKEKRDEEPRSTDRDSIHLHQL